MTGLQDIDAVAADNCHPVILSIILFICLNPELDSGLSILSKIQYLNHRLKEPQYV